MTAGVLSSPLALWKANLQIMHVTYVRVMYKSLSIISFLGGKSGACTPFESSVELDESFRTKHSTSSTVDVRT